MKNRAFTRTVGPEQQGNRLEIDLHSIADAFEVLDGDASDLCHGPLTFWWSFDDALAPKAKR